jgi:hypothetical protein
MADDPPSPCEDAAVPESSSQHEDAHSEHSWEMVSQSGRYEADREDEQVASSPIATPVGSPAISPRPSDAEQILDTEAYAFTSAEDIHSDADTYNTDDVFRHGEPEPLLARAWGTANSTATHNAQDNGDADDHHNKDGDEGKSRREGDESKSNPLFEGSFEPSRGERARMHAARLAAVPGRIIVSLADRLRFLAARVCDFVARRRPAVEELAVWLKTTATALMSSLRLRVASGSVAASDLAAAVALRVRIATAQAQARIKSSPLLSSSYKASLDWPKLALMLGCGTLAAALYRSNAANARLAVRLAQREGELAELVARIVALQRSVTSQPVAIIRRTHGSCGLASGWPVMVQAI